MIYLRWKLYTSFYRPLTFHEEYYILCFVLLETVVWGRLGPQKLTNRPPTFLFKLDLDLEIFT